MVYVITQSLCSSRVYVPHTRSQYSVISGRPGYCLDFSVEDNSFLKYCRQDLLVILLLGLEMMFHFKNRNSANNGPYLLCMCKM